MFGEQKNEAGEQLGHSFPRVVVLELGGDHGQPPSGGGLMEQTLKEPRDQSLAF